MPLPRQRRLPPVARWPTEDWAFAHWFYRGLKASVESPLKRLVPIRWKGVENVPLTGGAVLVPNHFSYADPVVLGAVVPRPIWFLANEKLFEQPLLRSLVTATNQIKVDRPRGGNDAAVDAAAAVVRQGLLAGVFPEGARARDGEALRWRSGAARVALATGAPVVPIAMTTDRFFPKHARVPRFGEPVYINIGTPLRLPSAAGLAGDRDAARAAIVEIMARVTALLEEATAARDRDEPWPREGRHSGTP